MSEIIVSLGCFGMAVWSVLTRPEEYDWLGRILGAIFIILTAIYLKL